MENIRMAMPPLQQEVKERLMSSYELSSYDATQLSEDTELADLFFTIARETNNYKAAANWLMGPVKNYLAEEDKTISEINLNPSFLTQLISLIDDGIINFGIASQKIFPHLINNTQVDLREYIRTEVLQIKSADET